jgi:carbon storage regulator
VLVLSRKQGESVVIGNDILVTVLEVRGDQIRLGIDAPRSITVHRQEVYIQVARENSAAIASADRGSPLLRRPVPRAVAKPDIEPEVEPDGES